MSEEQYWIEIFRKPLKRLARIAGIAMAIGALPAILLYVFAFSIKTSDEYRCTLQILEENRQVLSITGSPIRPGWFAWTKYYESGGMVSQGVFWTYITGPDGSGTVDVGFYRAPVGDTLEIWFSANNDEIEVYNGVYPCDE
jgi:hypothetical protein